MFGSNSLRCLAETQRVITRRRFRAHPAAAPLSAGVGGLVRRAPPLARGGGGFLALFLFLLREILRFGFSREGDALSVRRQTGLAAPFGQISKNKRIGRLPSADGKLWRLRLAILFQSRAEQQKFSSGDQRGVVS